jgi:membrane fusion protein (multidrug efflux system)
MKRQYKKIIAGIVSLIVFVLMFMWLTGNLSGKPKIAPGKVEVEGVSAAGLKTLTVSAVTLPVRVEAVGTVTARETAEISSRIMATVAKAMADAGQKVETGQTLFVLDSRDAQARVMQSKEALASAEAALEQASLDAGRTGRLYEKQAATKQEYDRSQASLKMAKASVEAAKAMVREAEVNLSYTKVDSPLSGKVIERLADPGDMAAPGKPLMSIYVPSTLRLEVSVAENLRPKVHLGDTVGAAIDSLGEKFEGKIIEVVPASNVSSRSFIVRVSVPESDAIYPGMYGRMWVPIGNAETILVPSNAVEHVGQLDMVTTVKNGMAYIRMVRLGNTHPEGVEILSGLSPGEVIAVP